MVCMGCGEEYCTCMGEAYHEVDEMTEEICKMAPTKEPQLEFLPGIQAELGNQQKSITELHQELGKIVKLLGICISNTPSPDRAETPNHQTATLKLREQITDHTYRVNDAINIIQQIKTALCEGKDWKKILKN